MERYLGKKVKICGDVEGYLCWERDGCDAGCDDEGEAEHFRRTCIGVNFAIGAQSEEVVLDI